jgi:predicted hotdog family 3-hydroxylacyl-ACP dehydratase
MIWPIGKLLPHAAPMILVERVVAFDQRSARVEVTVRADHPFATPDGVPAHLGLEYLAQACGALTGCWARSEAGPVRVGLLLGTRHYRAADALFPIGLRMTAEIELVARNAGMAVFDCRLLDGEKLMAEAELNVYQAENDE